MLLSVLLKTRNLVSSGGFIFLVNFFINYLEDADYQGTELNTRRAVLRVSTEAPHHPGHDVSEVGTSPGLFLKSCSDQF